MKIINAFFGEYYAPDCQKIYEGPFINCIPKESKNIIIYNNNNTYKIFEGEISNGQFVGFGIEYCPFIKDKILYEGIFKNGLYALPDFDLRVTKGKILNNYIKIILLSTGDKAGKTPFSNRLLGKDYPNDDFPTLCIDTFRIDF